MDVMTLAAKLTLNTSEFDSNLDKSEKSMQGVSLKTVAIGNLTSRIISLSAKAVKDFAKDAIDVSMGFDAMMSDVKAISGADEEQFEKLRKKAMQLGESTKFTAEESALAFHYMAMAGWDVEDMLAGVDGVIMLAAASGENLGTTSDIVTDALTAFGMAAEDAIHFANLLATTSASANTNVSMMGQSFKYIAPFAGAFGVNADQIAESLGLIANNGIKASQAGTSMRRIFSNLGTNQKSDVIGAHVNDYFTKLGEQYGLNLNFFNQDTDAAALKEYNDFIDGLKEGNEQYQTYLNETKDIVDETGEINEKYLDSNGNVLDEYVDMIDAIFDAREAIIRNYIDNDKELKDTEEMLWDEIIKNTDVRDWDEYLDSMRQLWNMTDSEGNAMFTDEQKIKWAKGIAGQTGLSAWLALMNSTQEDIDDLREAISLTDEGEGDAARMANTMLDNLQGDITILNSALDGLKIVVSDQFKEQLRSFVQTLTEEIGKLNEAFQANGVLGLFTNLATWIINGVVSALTEPTDSQVTQFGNAIGTFIGQVVAKLVTNLPAMIGGIITLGESLASGLVTGLFQGLFGDNTEVKSIVDQLQNELSDVEVNDVKAKGLLNTLERLAKAGDANVTSTDAWKTAVEELEKIMPGVKEELEKEGSTLLENIEHVRTMTDEFRKQAIQQALVSTLQKEYEALTQQEVERTKFEIKRDQAEDYQKAIYDSIKENIILYAERFPNYFFDEEEAEKAKQGYLYAGGEYVSMDELDFYQLKMLLERMQSLGYGYDGNLWDKDQNYLSPKEVARLSEEYKKSNEEILTTKNEINDINKEIDATKLQIETTEKAVQKVSEELGVTAEGVDSSGSSVVTALNGVASEISGIHFNSESDGSHAKGLWDVPYNDYVATLHRGEMVLTASQARQYREGASGGNLDMTELMNGIVGAIQSGMSGATVNAYMNGKNVSSDVDRNIVRQTKARRFAP